MKKRNENILSIDTKRCDAEFQKAFDRTTEIKKFIDRKKALLDSQDDKLAEVARKFSINSIEFYNFYSTGIGDDTYNESCKMRCTVRLYFRVKPKNLPLLNRRMKAFVGEVLPDFSFSVQEFTRSNAKPVEATLWW